MYKNVLIFTKKMALSKCGKEHFIFMYVDERTKQVSAL